MTPSSPTLTQLQAAVGVLAQLAPAVGAETTLYQVPNANRTFIAELVVCNRTAAPATFRLSISLRGAATATTDYLYFDLSVSGNDTFASEIGVTLGAGDIIRVYTATGNITFNLFGMPV